MTLIHEKFYDSLLYRLYVSELKYWGIKGPIYIGGIMKRYHDLERKRLLCSCRFDDNFSTVFLLELTLADVLC